MAVRGLYSAVMNRGSLQTLAGRGTEAARLLQTGPRESGNREGKDVQLGTAICGEMLNGPGDQSHTMGFLTQGWRRSGGTVQGLMDRGSVHTQHVATLHLSEPCRRASREAGSRKVKWT